MSHIVDLSLTLYDKAKVFDLDPKTEFEQYHTIDSLGYNIKRLTMSSHIGTHVDAPNHFLEDGKTIEDVALSKFVGEATIIDLSHKKAGSVIDVSDLMPHESSFKKDAKVLLRTDWGLEYGKDAYFSQFPRITIAVAEWIAEKKIGLLGLETPSVNPDDYARIHQILLGEEIVILEGLVNLKELPSTEFELIALPLKIGGGDGSPVRAIGMY